ncbi:MAG: uroporphyrinogen decarboxylase, partial [Nitrospirae bacterium]
MSYVFIKACRGEEVPYTPIWLMRQAGRYMEEYREVRSRYDFMTLCKTPELAAKVSLQPVKALDVDAAIVFSDILVVIEAMGCEIDFPQQGGPVINNPIRSKWAVEGLKTPNIEDALDYVLKTIRILKNELESRLPVIGFSGAPFTLATYMIEGGASKNFVHTKSMMYNDPLLFSSIMGKLTKMISLYLEAQIDAGVHAVQLFDTWAGVLSPCDYEEYALPYVKEIVNSLKEKDTPIIYFVNGCCGLLKQIKEVGADVISIDWKIKLSDAIEAVGYDRVFQGNLDPCLL